MTFILAQLNLNDWLSNTSLFYKNMWIWDQRTIRSAKITIQWAINSGWTHFVTAKPQLFSHWRKVKHITEHCKLRKPKLTWQSHVWISLAGLLGGKVGLLLVQALHRLLGRGWCCPVDREYVVHLVSYTALIREFFGTHSPEIITSKVQSSELKQWEETKEGNKKWHHKSKE